MNKNIWLDLSIATKINTQILQNAGTIPLFINSNKLIIATLQNAQIPTIIKTMFHRYELEPTVISEDEFNNFLSQITRAKSLDSICEEIKSELKFGAKGGESAILRLIKAILSECVRLKASDIHIEPNENGCLLRARIDGALVQIFSFEEEIYNALCARIKLLSGLDIAERKAPQDGRFSMEFNENKCDFRVSSLPLVDKESIVLRILYKTHAMLELNSLGMEKEQLTKLKSVLERTSGMLLVTGPTGCGKSTTLYAALNQLKDASKKIITIENPVEYRLALIQQVSISKKLEFSTALRAILRQDPDIIMIGEIRDPDTLNTSIQAALSGHFVLSTLHTSDALGAIVRMSDLGAANYLIASSLSAVLAQRLIRLLCPHCKRVANIPDSLPKSLNLDLKNLNFYTHAGCQKCMNTGYIGRTMISELVIIDENLASLISKGANKSELKNSLNKKYETLLESGIKLAASGKTSLEEVFKSLGEPF